ncbi:Athe_2463 domain-containing protein [Paenibacillus vini]|uniref:Uncharacterized protein n=1 Tax=Paenibacillus vini TaxID=1476024 RepID=A0ABQ4M619_9BACL|nr:hypothetical protein [Paenibacillus vini]GIP51362.1 hypothetical protein J42TS3_03970 [Paenibacillus vini]
MKKITMWILISILLFSVIPYKALAVEKSDASKVVKLLNELNEAGASAADEVLKRANHDMNEIYEKEDYFLERTGKGAFNQEGIIKKRIQEGLSKPTEFYGFEIVYGKSHDDYFEDIKMYRYSGYSINGDPVSTKGFPWDAGWSGKQIQNFDLVSEPWKNMKEVRKNNFDNYKMKNVPDNLKEALPDGTFEKLIQAGLDREYGGRKYGDGLMYHKNKERAGLVVYTKGAKPNRGKGKWIDYVHVIQPPTYLSQGYGRIYINHKDGSITYLGIPIAAFSTLDQGPDLSAEFETLPSAEVAEEGVLVSVRIRSDFKEPVTAPYEWIITRKADGKRLTADDGLKFTGHALAETGNLAIPAGGKRLLNASFIMPDSDVRVQFKINKDGNSPKEDDLTNNVLDSDPDAIKLTVPQALPYDALSIKYREDLPSNTATLQLPQGKWKEGANATGRLNVVEDPKDLYRNFDDDPNPDINEPGESFTRSPIARYTIKREDFGDNPAKGSYLNPEDPEIPLTRDGKISYSGSVSRPYTYEESYQSCEGKDKDGQDICTTQTRTVESTATADFTPGELPSVFKMYVYNGMEEVPPPTDFKTEIEENSPQSLQKKLYWVNEPYKFDVIRWMNHLGENKKPYKWEMVPGQYEREFTQQASGEVTIHAEKTMEEEYGQARSAASKRTNKKSQYDKAVFATDKELQKYDYPIKSGYYFNPAGEYTFTVKTVTYKQTTEDTADHQDLVDSLIDSFKYESDLIYINSNKEAVNLRNEKLKSNNRGGFATKPGVLTAKNNTGVNGAVLLEVLDRNDTTQKRYTKKVNEIPHSQNRDGYTHDFWKMVMEGYSLSKTEGKNLYYKYREYVKDGQHIYRITETTKVTIKINPNNLPVYTHANMQDGEYSIHVSMDSIDLTGNHAYNVLGSMDGVEELDHIGITVVGSMFDDLNN